MKKEIIILKSGDRYRIEIYDENRKLITESPVATAYKYSEATQCVSVGSMDKDDNYEGIWNYSYKDPVANSVAVVFHSHFEAHYYPQTILEATEPPTSKPLKRYWLFMAANYYPIGGMKDFAGAFDSVEAALEYAYSVPKINYDIVQDHIHVVDTETATIVACEGLRKLENYTGYEDSDKYFKEDGTLIAPIPLNEFSYVLTELNKQQYENED